MGSVLGFAGDVGTTASRVEGQLGQAVGTHTLQATQAESAPDGFSWHQHTHLMLGVQV